MRVPHRTVHVASLLVILAWAHSLEAKKLKTPICPIGFKRAYNRAKGDYICYKRKEPETFSAVLDDCDGNLYSLKLYNSLDIAEEYSDIVWTDYKSIYPGGPFVSWSQNEEDWSIINDVDSYEPFSLRYETDQNLCLVVNRTGENIAVKCDDKFPRYCLVKPYTDLEDLSKKGCEGLKDSRRFVNSKDICLWRVTGVGGGTVRATWNQSQALCSRHGGTLLSRGWRYANMPHFHISDVSPTPTYPLGIVWDPERGFLRSGDSVVEKPYESFSLNNTGDTFIAIRNGSWMPVDSSYLFFDVICEHPVQPNNLTLSLSISLDNKIILDVNDSVDKDDIHCTTDSESYRPTKVKIHHDDDEENYVLSPATDGYYWCKHINRYNLQTVQSNKVLFVREKDSLVNLYSIQIKLMNDKYTFFNAAKKKEEWINQLQEYVFYRTKYIQLFDIENISNPKDAQRILQDFKASQTELSRGNVEVIYNSVIKRLYMNKNTVLLHVELNPEMIPVTPVFWGDIQVVAMKPAYYCKGFDSVPRLSIGESTNTSSCKTYSCIGDFNEGVQWLESKTEACDLSYSTAIYNEITIRMPTLGTTIKHEYRDIAEEDVETEDLSELNPDDAKNETESSYEKNVMTEETSTVNVTDSSDEEDEEVNDSTPTTRYYVRPPYTTESVTVVDTPKPTPWYPPISVGPPTVTPPPEETTVPPPIPPDEQLVQVIHDLEELLQDNSAPLTIDMVDNAFDQVNNILEVEEDLEIPGNFLHLLDDLGTRIYLNGSHTASTIRNNIALLMADTAPENPVRGVRMATVDPSTGAFTNNTFDFINSEINSTQIASNQSEAVVYLPESVTSTPRRISFVVFRNERAFRGNQTVSVNSRIVSVNVENVTDFEAGECPCCDSRHHNYSECKCCHPRNRREVGNLQDLPPPQKLQVLREPISDYAPRKIFHERLDKAFSSWCGMDTFAVVNQSSVTLFTINYGNVGYTTHPFFEDWLCKRVTRHDIKVYNPKNRDVTFLKSYARNYTWPAFKQCHSQYFEDEFCFCCLMASNQNVLHQDLRQSTDYWDSHFGISPLPKDMQNSYKNYWSVDIYDQDYDTLDSEKVFGNETAAIPIPYPNDQDYEMSTLNYEHQNLNNSKKWPDLWPRCITMGPFAIVNRSSVTLFTNTELLRSHPLFEDWVCKQETMDNIKKYSNGTQVTFLKTYRRNLQWPAFRSCGVRNPGDEFCFCCQLPNYNNQNNSQLIEYWDNLHGISPLPEHIQQMSKKYWNSRLYGENFITWDSEKDQIFNNETTASLPYPDVQDYEDYEDYDPGESDLLEWETTTNPSFQVNVEIEETGKPMEFKTTTAISTVTVDQDQVLEELEVLLQNESSIPLTSMDSALDNVNSLFEAENVSLTGELLQKLDRLGPRVDLEGSQSAMIVRDNVAVIVVEANPQHPIKALRITTDRNDAFNNDCFDLITDEDYTQYLPSNESDAVVSLPSYLASSYSRMSFVIFRDDRAFQHAPGRSDAIVNSRILSVNVENVTEFEGEGVLTLYFRPTKSDIDRKLRRACAYWQFLDDGTGYWSEDGCSFVQSSTGILDICQCDHLTHFAEVLIAVNRFSEENEFILEVLSVTGCCLSILGILLVVVTALVFHSWRKEFSNKVWLQLCLAIFIFSGCFLVITFVEFERDIWCMATGIIMHYSLLVSFFWMLVAALISYENLVLVFKSDITRKLLKSSIFAWGIPLLIIVILLCVNNKSYMGKFDDTSRNSSFCYPSGLSLWLTVYLPLLIILLVNWSIFIVILRSMLTTKKIRRHGNSKDSLRSAVVSSLLVFLFGLPWIFGLIAYNVIAAYIFTVTASYQGFVLFIFFIVANKRTRDLWITKLRTEKGRSVQTTTESVTFRSGGSDRVGRLNSSNVAGPSNRTVSSIKLQRLGAVKLRESDEIRSLLQKGVSTFKTGYTRPDQKPDEYYE